MYFLYMIKNSANRLYIGVTADPEKRVHYHNERRGARFTKYRPDFKIVFLEQYETLADARKRKIQLKKWSQQKKEVLIERYSEGFPTKMNARQP